MSAPSDDDGRPAAAAGSAGAGPPLLSVSGLKTHFPVNTGFVSSIRIDRTGGFPIGFDRSVVRAVDGVSFDLERGETFGIVGESGCGKSTLARTILGLEEPTAGDIAFDGENVTTLNAEQRRWFRENVQMVFQDPQSSLNPRRRVGDIIADPLDGAGWPSADPSVMAVPDVRTDGLHDYAVEVSVDDNADRLVDAVDGTVEVPVTVRRGDPADPDDGGRDDDISVDLPWGFEAEVTVDEEARTVEVAVSVSATKKEIRRERVFELLDDVGLNPEYYNRYPHEFSGGQRQRINLARALSINPDLVVADEPVSGLDMSVQAQILRLMNDLQDEYGLTYLIITHDLGVVRNVADRVAVMYLGDFVEVGPIEPLFTEPHHPYTRELLGAVPNPDPETPPARSRLVGDVPSPENPPTGCKFHTRCPELIVPEGIDRETYRAYADVRMAVVDKSIETGSSVDEVVSAYFDEPPPAALERAVARALELVAEGDWTAALAALDEHATTCLVDRPQHRQYTGPRHTSACHLDMEDREPFGG